MECKMQQNFPRIFRFGSSFQLTMTHKVFQLTKVNNDGRVKNGRYIFFLSQICTNPS
jgi:hypothetical protein